MRFHRYFIPVSVLIGFSICLNLPLSAQSSQIVGALSPDQPSRVVASRAANYQVDYRVVLTAPPGTRTLRVWLPVPSSDEAQQISDRRFKTFPIDQQATIHSEPEFGNRFAYFEFHSPDGPQQIRHRFAAKIHQMNWDVRYASVKTPQRWPESFSKLRIPDQRSRDASAYLDVLHQIKSSSRTSSDQLLDAMRWIDRNLTYDKLNASLSADPVHAASRRRGHCSDYHGLCGTLARQIGYPSRVLYGLQMWTKDGPSHCKLEIFLPPYGWVTYDLSETQKLASKIMADESLELDDREQLARSVKQRSLRGFRENSWLQVTRGVDYDLAPPASARVFIIRELYAEADGEPLADSAMTSVHKVTEVGDASRRFDEFEK